MIADEFIKNIEKTLSDPEKLKKFADVLIENLVLRGLLWSRF